MNKILLIGNLGRDPEMNYSPAGVAVAKFSLATTRFAKKDGERAYETEWFNIVAFRDLAERCSAHLKKGQKIYIEGRLSTRKYTDKNNIERIAIEVIASDIEFLTPRENREEKNEDSSGEEELDANTPF